MYRLLIIMMSVVLVTGCEHLKKNDFLNRTGEALSKIGQGTSRGSFDQEVEPLFDQPYIDPLTEYLLKYGDDPSRKAQLEQVRQERERRCSAVALRYKTDEISEAGLALYRRGYNFSCPEDVAAYEARLTAMQQKPDASKQPGREPVNAVSDADNAGLAGPIQKADPMETHVADEIQKVVVSRQLNDCYLLTRIRNFSAALETCRGPAEKGAVGAQANMAQIQSALGHHESAYHWASQAAPESGEAANLLGKMYAQGLGVEQDKDTAEKWLRTAVELGHNEAQNTLDKLNSATVDTHVN